MRQGALIVAMVGLLILNGCRSNRTSTSTSASSSPVQWSVGSPRTGWERVAFIQIDELAQIANLPRLQSTSLPNGDLEARFWSDAGYFGREGVVIRRANGAWSGTHVLGPSKYTDFKKSAHQMKPPHSGWDAVWQRLVEAHVLELPDASEVGCVVVGNDGVVFVFETKVNGAYRTYHYDNPMFAKCEQAKDMIKLVQILKEEFDLSWPARE